jgi:hypothetical protein
MWDFLKANLSREDVITCLEDIIEGRKYAWDFTDVPIKDPALDEIRLKVLSLEESHASPDGSAYLNAEGIAILQGIVRELRERSVPDQR